MNSLNRLVNRGAAALKGVARVLGGGRCEGLEGQGEAEGGAGGEGGLKGKEFGFGAEFDAVEELADLAVGDLGFGAQGGEGDEPAGAAEFDGGLGETVFQVGAGAGELVGGDGFEVVGREQEHVQTAS